MKQRVLLLGSLVLFFATALAWAQSSTASSSQNTTGYFVKTIYINKVFPTKDGYVVAYADSHLNYQEAYLPMKWFNEAGGKGQLLYGYGKTYPYMNIFWKDGKFDHVQLYLVSSYNDPSWGTMEETPDLASKFNADTLQLKY